MSEVPVSAEFGPEDQEASPAAIHALMGAIVAKLVQEPTADFSPTEGGSGSWLVGPDRDSGLNLEYRPHHSTGPMIEDFLTGKPLPGTIAAFMRSREDHRFTSDPLSQHAEIEEIWISEQDGQLRLRRRVYGYEQINYRAMQELLDNGDRATYRDAERRFNERKEEQLARQPAFDAEEEMLGLNRLTNKEVREHIALIQGQLESSFDAYDPGAE